MTTVQITLPDQLAQDAQSAGLLAPARLEQLLRDQLESQRVDELFAAMDRMAAVDVPAAMSPDQDHEKNAVEGPGSGAKALEEDQTLTTGSANDIRQSDQF